MIWPTFVTLAALIAAYVIYLRDARRLSHFAGMMGCVSFPIALGVSIIAWLVWALSR